MSASILLLNVSGLRVSTLAGCRMLAMVLCHAPPCFEARAYVRTEDAFQDCFTLVYSIAVPQLLLLSPYCRESSKHTLGQDIVTAVDDRSMSRASCADAILLGA